MSQHNADTPTDITAVLETVRILQARVEELEAANLEIPGEVGYSKSDATTLYLHPKLLENYPAISEPNFFKAKLPDKHKVFNWDDFHYTEGMEYKAPNVLEHAEVTLAPAAKQHDNDLSTVQGYIASSTRFFDTYAQEIVRAGDAGTRQGSRMLGFLNMVRRSAANDAANISTMREKLYYDALGIKQENGKKKSLLTMEQLATAKSTAEMVRTTYKKPEPPKPPKQSDNKPKKDKSGWKPKSQYKTRSRSQDRSDNKSDGGYKSDKKSSDKSKFRSSSKSRGKSYSKRPNKGNEEEESDQ